MKTYYRFDSLEQMDQLVKKYGADYFGYVPPKKHVLGSGFLIRGDFGWRGGTIECLKNTYPEANIITFEEAMKNNFKKGDKVVCVDTTDALNDKLVLGEVYTVDCVWDWGNIDVRNHRGEFLHNYKPWRFKSLEIPIYVEVLADHYDAIIEENKELKSRIDFYIQYNRRASNAAAIFQPDGKYHKEANLPLGSSCVVEGIKWMDKEIERLKKELECQKDISERLYSRLDQPYFKQYEAWKEKCFKLSDELDDTKAELHNANNRLDKIKELC